MFCKNKKLTFKNRTFVFIFALFLLVTFGQKNANAVEFFPFEFISEVNDFSILTTAIESDGEVFWLGSLNGLIMIRPGETEVFNVLSKHTQTNHVSNIVVNDAGEVWAAYVGGGVFYFNRKTEEHYLLQDKYKLEDLNCFDVEIDEQLQKLIMACDTAFYSLDLFNGTLQSHDIYDENGSRVEGFYSLASVEGKNWLVGTWGRGLFSIDKTTLAADKTTLAADKTNLAAQRIAINQNYIHHINVVSSEKAVISTDNGVYFYLIEEDIVAPIPIQTTEEITDYSVLSTISIGDERLLLVFSAHGLFELNALTGSLSKIQLYSPFLQKQYVGHVDAVSLHQNGLSVSIGTDERGFYVLPLKYNFTRYFTSSALARSEISMIDTLDGSLFIGDWQNLVRFRGPESEIFTKDIGASQFIVDNENGYLLSTLENGFVKIDKSGNIIGQSLSFNGLPSGTSSSFSEILQIAADDYLLGTVRGKVQGIYRGNFVKGFKQVHDSGGVSNMIKIAPTKVMISSTYEGIIIYDLDKEVFDTYSPSIDGLYIDCLEQLNEHQFFLCLRRNKAVVFNTLTYEFSEFLPEQPLLRNIRDADMDKNGLLWLSSSYGLYVYDKSSNRAIRITNNEGVKSNDFSPDGMLLHNNRLIVSGNKGIVEIDVDKAKAFLDFKKFQKTTSFITQAQFILDDQAETQRASGQTIVQGLALPHSNILLKLQFSHNNFLELGDLAFDVRMVGLKDEWTTLDVGEYSATYTTLPPGEYEFQVRVNDPRSLAAQPIRNISVSIRPPWWQTSLAYIGYLVLLLLAFYLFSWYRHKRLITLNKQLSQKVTERTATISNLLQQKQTFFANVSHEFRTPLSLIMGPLDVVTEAIKAPELQKHLAIMCRNGKRLMKLVDQILDLAKFETNQSLPKQVYELKWAIEIIAASFAPLLENKQQSLRLNNVAETKISLVEDSFEIIMTNLLSNASKYCPQGSEFVITMKKNDTSIEIQVADNGPGISEENQEVLFERFTRFEVVENIQGSGIGLALVKQLVANNDGEIRVASKPGEGTSFYVSFPLNVKGDAEVTRVPMIQVLDSEFTEEQPIKSDKSANSKTATESGSQSQPKPRLLIVEDNADLRAFLSDFLEQHYDLDIAVNGEQGLKKAHDAIPDLILSDVLMPVMDGYELANAIRSDEVTSHIPIILLTAKGDDLSRMKGWQEQVDDYLSKPFKMSELKIRIQRLLAIRDILRKKHTSAVANHLATKNQEAISFQTKKDADFFSAFEKIIEEHYSEESFSRADAARCLFIEPRQLNRKLAALMDYNFSEYLRRFRLQKSTELLLLGKQVTEVAYDVGFSSPSYFSSCFKAEFDETPSKFVEKRESEQSKA